MNEQQPIEPNDQDIHPESEANHSNLSETDFRSEDTDIKHPEYTRVNVEPVRTLVHNLEHELGKVIIGQEVFIRQLIATLLAGGHALIEGVPGIAKTLTAKMLSKACDLPFKRIQFTPDLMPSDVLGTAIFDIKSTDFTFREGPIFSNIILIDEINRAPAKTQAALFEVMEEQQVTIDGRTYPMSSPFFVMATQNPIEQEGTYRLPEAQLDRFLFRIILQYPDATEELAILNRFRSDFNLETTKQVQKVVNAEMLTRAKSIIEEIFISDEILRYIATLVVQTRNHPAIYLGASPRASLAIMKTSKVMAAINGRDFVTPDDVRLVSYPVLNHRIILTPERELEGGGTEEVILEIIDGLEIPR